MGAAVLDAGVAIALLQGRHRSLPRIQGLFSSARSGRLDLVISVVNLVEVLIHGKEAARAAGVDPVTLLKAWGVRVHQPDEAVARRVARLPTSLADGSRPPPPSSFPPGSIPRTASWSAS